MTASSPARSEAHDLRAAARTDPRLPQTTKGAGRTTDPEKNKQTVLAYYDMVWNDKRPAEAVAIYVGPEYDQHNPQLADGPEAFVDFAGDFLERFPRSSLEIKRAIAEGDLVVLHGLLKTSPDDRGTAAMDILRLVEGKVVEHWDVLQPVPESSANGNAMV